MMAGMGPFEMFGGEQVIGLSLLAVDSGGDG